MRAHLCAAAPKAQGCQTGAGVGAPYPAFTPPTLTSQAFDTLEAREQFEWIMNELTDTSQAIADAGRYGLYDGNDYHPYINFSCPSN